MVAMRLPGSAPDDLQERLYDEHRIELPVFEGIVRVSIRGDNDERDVDALADALATLL